MKRKKRVKATCYKCGKVLRGLEIIVCRKCRRAAD